MEQQLVLDFSHCSIFCGPGSCHFLACAYLVCSPCAPTPRERMAGKGSWGIPLMKKLYWEASWTFCIRNCVWRVIFLLYFGFYFFLILFFPCGSLNCPLRKEELVEGLVMLPGVCWFRAPVHLLLAVLIRAHLSFHNSVLRFFSLFFLYFFLSLSIYFFSLHIACPVQQMWGYDPTSIEVNSQIPIDFADSESEPLSREWGLELSTSK